MSGCIASEKVIPSKLTMSSLLLQHTHPKKWHAKKQLMLPHSKIVQAVINEGAESKNI